MDREKAVCSRVQDIFYRLNIGFIWISLTFSRYLESRVGGLDNKPKLN